MATLTIKNFSCIDEAEITLSELTILIGPQASGKSVISKLVYFFNDMITLHFKSIEDEIQFEAFRARLSEDFKKWFPPSAWGTGPFAITYSAGSFFAKITRAATRKGVPPQEVKINVSPWFEARYKDYFVASLDRKKKSEKSDLRSYNMDFDWKLREAAEKKIKAELKTEYPAWQVFIPAGRSYFTSLGKALPAFEHSGLLDPLTVQFGRFFTSIREYRRRRVLHSRLSKRDVEARNILTRQLFGGNLRLDRELEYIEGEDGRKIPFAFMSSGQQELLPLWLTLEYVNNFMSDCLMFIEEPEAHLFPAAQSQVVEQLATTVAKPGAHVRMIITTHSPYVLTQFNVLLKAGTLAVTRPELATEIENIVKREMWLPPGSVGAYAIAGRRVKKIFDSDGLIDGLYLDEVSGNLENEFQSLLELENR